MDKRDKTILSIRATVNVPLARAWHFFTHPNHIVRWNGASDDWHCPQASNDLRVGGRFNYRMEARDASFAFDFEGTYTDVQPMKFIAYMMDDDRRVEISFEAKGGTTVVSEQFEAESTHPEEMQLAGWQAILDKYAAYTERKVGDNPLHFEIMIAAPAEKVQRLMLADQSYREWTALFNPGSFYEGSWDEGAEIRFIGLNENGEKEGMIGHIAVHKPQQYVSIAYTGVMDKGVDRFTGPDVDALASGREEYRFVARDGHTLLVIDMDDPGPYADYFKETWPLALQKLKEICER
jgi:uncharacterized protein YndB with AHSA1/START domain